jgi:tRNA threonylcarbamoyladenosine biosynthesis protein TsaE
MQGLAAARGAAVTSSPTYTLVNVYEEADVVHMDLYRLETDGDLESIGYWDYLEERGAIVAVEWVDQVPGAWPGEGVVVELRDEGAGRVARIWSSERGAPALERELADFAEE